MKGRRSLFLLYRQKIAEILRKRGYRVVSPFKVPIGWVDIASFRKGESVGIDIYAGNFESCAERLSSYPFTSVHIVEDGEIGEIEEIGEICGDSSIKIDVDVERILKMARNEVSMETKAVEDSLAFLYIVGEVFENELDDYNFKPLSISLPELKKYGFAVSHSRPKIGRKDFVTLTKEGVEIAKRIVTNRIILFENTIEELSKNPLTYLISLGASTSLSISDSEFRCEEKSYKSILEGMNSFSLESYHFPSECRNFTLNPKFLFAHFLVSTVLNEDALKLGKRLSEIGLAYRVKSYTPFGDVVGDGYAVAKEALEALMKFSYTAIDNELLNEFLAVLYPFYSRDVYPILGKCRDYLLKAERKGVCKLHGSKIDLTGDFEKYAKVRLSILADRFLSTI